MKILIILLIFQSLLFSADFQTRLSVSAGPIFTFSKAEHAIWYWKEYYDGFRVSRSKIAINALLSVGYNHKIKNDTLTSITILLETGYNYSGYNRPTDNNFGKEGGTIYFHSLILGLIPTLNFDNDFSLGIGAGVMFPLSANISGYLKFMGDYSGVSKLSLKDIKKLYKIPVMPYIKLSVEKYYYLSDKADLIAGGVLTYNFGMSCESEVLAHSLLTSFSYKSYKFSAISLEIFLAVGFGRPK